MKIRIVLAATALTLCGIANAQDEIVVAHEYRTAFYEIAPGSVANSMRTAVSMACAASSSGTGWLCDGRPVVFLRGVYVTGDKKLSGFVCLAPENDNIKFYTPDMLDGSDCVPIPYDGASGRHLIDNQDLKGD